MPKDNNLAQRTINNGFLIRQFVEYDLDNKQPTNAEIKEQLDRIEQKIDFIFNGHVLINGKWVNVKNILAPVVKLANVFKVLLKGVQS